MIDTETIFDEVKDILVLECPTTQCGTDLISIAEAVVKQNIPIISVSPESVEMIWTWLEKTPAKIMARFDKITDISELSKQINYVFKKGASGSQIYVPYSSLSSFISELVPIRDDLFFNKILSIRLDVDEINPLDWEDVFLQIKNIRADVLLLDFHNDIKKSHNFVGRIYGFLESLENKFDGELHFSLGNDYEKIEQVWRLIQKIRPEISNNVKFFVNS